MSRSARSLTGAVSFAVLWAVVAAIRPTTTFHLAPLIVAVWPGVAARHLERGAWLALAGGIIAVAATGVLSFADLLEGPSLLPWGDATAESLLAAAAGTILGLGISAGSRPLGQEN